MRLVARVVLGSILLLSSGLLFAGQIVAPANSSPPGSKVAVVSFEFERPGLAVPHFTFLLREDGTGVYKAEQAEMPPSGASMRGQAAQHIDRTVVLSSATVAKVFKAARELNYFNVACASKAKNIADTGKKTLSYSGADGHGSCVYNYSENKNVQMVGETFIGIASTLDEGRSLEFLHRYDRLGLDAEMTGLAKQVEEGRALEVGTISQTLAAIADDTAVMQRVRLKAAKMLEQSK
jgi:hypothetical protein